MDTSLLTTLALLDCAVFKRISALEFEVVHSSGSWLADLLPETRDVKRFTFEHNSAYLEDFLIDAESLWHPLKEGRVESGMWSEQLLTQLIRLEASAVVVANECYLIVHRLDSKYEQKQQTLQVARELLLSTDQIAAKHDYLNLRLEELLSEPSQPSNLQRPIAQALEQTDLGVAILDSEKNLVNSNPALQALFFNSDTHINSNLPPDKLLIELFQTQYPESERIFSTASNWTGEIYWLNPPKQGKWLKLSIHPIKGLDLKLQNWLLTVSDVTQVKYLLKQNERLTYFDALTDLPNRQYFWQQLEHKIQQRKPFYLLYMDIKHFKKINELHGHLVGDEVIKELAKRLNTTTRIDDTIARIGGTEFAVIMELNNLHSQISTRDQAQCTHFANELISACSLPFYISSGKKCEIGLNLGAAAFPADSDNAEDLMKYADLAVFSSKKEPTSSLSFYSKELVDASRKLIEMEEAIRHAISNQEFELFLQPMLSLTTGKIVKAEALIRWHRPTEGMVSPDDFIPLAEQTGLIIPIGKWVITQACKMLGHLHARGDNIKLSINLSPRQISDRQLFDFIQSSVEKHQIDPRQLELELTEGVLIDNYDKVQYLLNEVRKLGISISIDDFGTGYSSLSYLQKLPIDHLKIDRSFIKELNEHSDDSDSAIILAVIAMAKSLKLEVIAEGVETFLQKDFLKKHECNVAQGFLFSRPVPYDDFCSLLDADRELSAKPLE